MRALPLLCIALLAACSDSSSPLSSAMLPPVTIAAPKTDQVVIAHRGASGQAPEHTIAAYDLAIKLGAEYIEQDIAITLDGVLVMLHDETLDRTARGPAADCTGNIATKTLAQVKNCDMGSWFNEAFPDRAKPEYVGLKMPTLEEVFQRYGSSVNYYIETKTIGSPRPMEQTLLDLIKKYQLLEGAKTKRQVLVQSFTPESLQRMRALEPGIALIQLLTKGGTNTAVLQGAAAYAFGVGPEISDVTKAVVDEAHALGMAIHPYTANSNEEIEKQAALCVDGAFTNFTDRYRALLAAKDYGCQKPRR